MSIRIAKTIYPEGYNKSSWENKTNDNFNRPINQEAKSCYPDNSSKEEWEQNTNNTINNWYNSIYSLITSNAR